MTATYTIGDVILASQKMTGLLKEYQESKKYEQCDYHITQDHAVLPMKRYFLFRIAGQEQIKYSTPEVIRTWLSRRNVPDNKVYGIELITPKNIDDVTK